MLTRLMAVRGTELRHCSAWPLLHRASHEHYHTQPAWNSQCWLPTPLLGSAVWIYTVDSGHLNRPFVSTSHSLVKDSKAQQIREELRHSGQRAVTAALAKQQQVLVGHKYPPPPLLVTSALPGGDTAPAQLPLDLSQWLLGHVLCPAAQLHPKPVLLTFSSHANGFASSKSFKGCEVPDIWQVLDRYPLPCWHLGPRLALPRELKI